MRRMLFLAISHQDPVARRETAKLVNTILLFLHFSQWEWSSSGWYYAKLPITNCVHHGYQRKAIVCSSMSMSTVGKPAEWQPFFPLKVCKLFFRICGLTILLGLKRRPTATYTLEEHRSACRAVSSSPADFWFYVFSWLLGLIFAVTSLRSFVPMPSSHWISCTILPNLLHLNP